VKEIKWFPKVTQLDDVTAGFEQVSGSKVHISHCILPTLPTLWIAMGLGDWDVSILANLSFYPSIPQ
jgi:hypothetical protein